MDISKVTLNIDNLLGTSANKITHLAQAEGCLIYPSGNFIIFYSPILDEQVAYITHTSQYISSIVVSPDEKLLAVCQNAKHGSATIYPINNLQRLKGGSVKQVWTLRGHKFGIDHLVFSPNSQYIVTVSNQDGSMFLWENGEATTKNRISKSISKLIFDGKGDLLTIGKGYLKLWPFLKGNPIKKMQNQQAILQGRVMSFGKKFSTQDFIDGRVVNIDQTEKLVLLSSQGLICIISAGYQKIQKWIDVMMQGVSAMQLVDSIVICCGDHALVKAVDLQALEFKGKFPKPPPTNRQNLTEQQPLQYMENDEFPRCLGAKRVGRFVVTLYSNRTIFVWKLQDLNDIQAVRSILSHRGRVNCLAILQQVSEGELVFFASAAEDHTLRLWHYYGKQGSEVRRASDVGKMLDLRRNIYCKYLTHIIYTHSQHPITQIKPYKKTKIVCIARNEFIVYSIQNFGLFLIQNFEEAKLTALQTNGQLIFLGNQHKKVMVFQLLADKLEKKRQILFQPGVQRILSIGDRLLINGKTNALICSLQGQLLHSAPYSQKICVTGNYLLSCNNKILEIKKIEKSTSRTRSVSSVSLSHEMDEDEAVSLITSNSWLIVVITNKNRLILINFSATVLYSELIYQTVTDVQITQQGKIIMSGQSGVLFVKNQSTTVKYKQIDQKVKKWFENNDMSWMDGSVWANKNKSHTNSAQLSQQLPSNRQSLKHKISQELGPCEESIRLGDGGWADLSVSLKQPQAFNGAISYKNEDNKRSIFNPSSIVAQVNKIYKEVDQLQKGDKQRPPMADKTQKSKQESSSFLQQKSLLSLSKGKKRIFDSKQEYFPKFTNNLVQSIIDEAESAHQKVTTQTQQQPSTAKQHQQQSVDFQLSNFEEGHHSKISQGPVLQYTRTKSPSVPHQQFLDSVKDLMGIIDNENEYQNILSMICQHSQQYYKLYKVLDRVFEQREKKNCKQNMLKRMDSLWAEMKSKLQKQF